MPATSVTPAASTPWGSETLLPSIWKPPQTPKTGTPLLAAFSTEASSPLWRSQRRSAMVLLVPGRMMRSGSFRSSGFPT